VKSQPPLGPVGFIAALDILWRIGTIVFAIGAIFAAQHRMLAHRTAVS